MTGHPGSFQGFEGAMYVQKQLLIQTWQSKYGQYMDFGWIGNVSVVMHIVEVEPDLVTTEMHAHLSLMTSKFEGQKSNWQFEILAVKGTMLHKAWR